MVLCYLYLHYVLECLHFQDYLFAQEVPGNLADQWNQVDQVILHCRKVLEHQQDQSYLNFLAVQYYQQVH